MKKIIYLLVLTLIFSCKKEKSDIDIKSESLRTGSLLDTTSIFPTVDLPSGSGSSLASSYDLSSFMPPIRNQGSQGSCVGFCISYLKSYHERLEKGYTYTNNDKIMSPAFVYNKAKEPGSCGSGTYTINALNLIRDVGICTENEFPYNVNNCTNQPSQSITQNAYRNRIRQWAGFDFINKSNSTILNEMKYYINQMQPIVIDMHVDDNFSRLGFNTSNEATWTTNFSSYIGYHCLLIVGYDDNKNAFKVWNSWGTDWGNDGWIWIDYNMFFRNVSKAFVTWDVFDNTPNPTSSISITGNLNYGNVQINNSTYSNITVKNTGTTNVTLNSISLPNGFFHDLNLPVTLTANQTVTFKVYFGPTNVQTYSGDLVVICNPSSANKSTTITGNGINNNGPKISASISSPISGDYYVRSSIYRSIRISNTGNSTLNISDITMSNYNYRVVGPANFTVLSNQYIDVLILFTPDEIQTYNNTLTIHSDAINNNSYEMYMSANGISNHSCANFYIPNGGPVDPCDNNEIFSITTFSTGGTPPYKYYLNNIYYGENNDGRYQWCLNNYGNYQVLVRDALGCEIRTTVER